MSGQADAPRPNQAAGADHRQRPVDTDAVLQAAGLFLANVVAPTVEDWFARIRASFQATLAAGAVDESSGWLDLPVASELGSYVLSSEILSACNALPPDRATATLLRVLDVVSRARLRARSLADARGQTLVWEQACERIKRVVLEAPQT